MYNIFCLFFSTVKINLVSVMTELHLCWWAEIFWWLRCDCWCFAYVSPVSCSTILLRLELKWLWQESDGFEAGLITFSFGWDIPAQHECCEGLEKLALSDLFCSILLLHFKLNKNQTYHNKNNTKKPQDLNANQARSPLLPSWIQVTTVCLMVWPQTVLFNFPNFGKIWSVDTCAVMPIRVIAAQLIVSFSGALVVFQFRN